MLFWIGFVVGAFAMAVAGLLYLFAGHRDPDED